MKSGYRWFVVFLCLLVVGAVACTQPAKATVEKSDQEDWVEIVSASNNFAWNLYAKLADEEGNLFFSPGSIHTALAMTCAGARRTTEDQMFETLCFPMRWPQGVVHKAYARLLKQLKPGKDAGYELQVANALWGQKGYPWLEEFLARTRTDYGAGLREVDFLGATEQARKTINAWVEEQTKDKIRELLRRGILTGLTRLVLTNAIYFKGDWASKFDEKATREAPFKVSLDKSVQVPMMNQTGGFRYAETDELQILRMPYQGEDLSMVILLPRKVNGLAALERTLSAQKVTALIGKLQQREVIVSVPKFKLTRSFGLGPTLRAMGMEDAFTGAADFSGMNGQKDLFISAVVHKAFVDVNEEGTEAAAATAVVMRTVSVRPRPPVFRADRPFLFIIRHEKTGAILFIGRLVDPNA